MWGVYDRLDVGTACRPGSEGDGLRASVPAGQLRSFYGSCIRVVEAKDLAVDLIVRAVGGQPLGITLDTSSPDGDVDKFVLDGRVARAIHHFSGWSLPINLDWFAGSFDPPVINRESFHWYVFAIPRLGQRRRDHYFICDCLQMRDWVPEFAAPLGRDHRDHNTWRADLRVFPDDPEERIGYFRWGDEPVGSTPHRSRVFELDRHGHRSLSLAPRSATTPARSSATSSCRQLT